MFRKSIFVGLILSLIICPSLVAGSKVISESQFGKEWPFSVARGTLECINGHMLVFHVNGKTYAVNGAADGAAKSKGYRDLREIWRNNPEYDKYYSKNDPDHPKINIGPIIEEGLKLCR